MGIVQNFLNTYKAMDIQALLLGSRPYKPMYVNNGYNPNSSPYMYPNTILGASTPQGEVTLSGTTAKTLLLFHIKTTTKKLILKKYEFIVNSNTSSGDCAFQVVKVNSFTGTMTPTDIGNGSVLEHEESPTITITSYITLLESSWTSPNCSLKYH